MSSYSDFADAASNILLKKGEALAGGKARSGELWGSALATLGDVVPKQVQAVMQQVAAKKKQAQIQALFQQSGGNLEQVIPQLRAIDPELSLKFEKELSAADEVRAKATELKAKHDKELRDFQMNVIANATDESQYASGLKGLHDSGFDTSMYDPVFSDAAVRKANRILMTPEQRAKQDEPPPDYTIEGARISGKTNQPLYTAPPKVTTPKTWAEIALDAENPDSPTQAQSRAAQDTHTKIQAKNLNPASVEYYITKKYGTDPTPEQVLEGHEAFAKSTARGTAAGDIPVKLEKYDPVTGRTIVTYVPRSQAVGQSFEKAPSATLQNRLESAKAVNQTGEDIIAQLKDPKVAAMLGPMVGRYNTVRDFIGDPPPELAELAGRINSFGIAQMGVHGMRNAQAAAKIEEMLTAKFTPAALIAKIKGINDFGTHLLENRGMSTGPKVGDLKTFPNGNKGRWDGKGWELVK